MRSLYWLVRLKAGSHAYALERSNIASTSQALQIATSQIAIAIRFRLITQPYSALSCTKMSTTRLYRYITGRIILFYWYIANDKISPIPILKPCIYECKQMQMFSINFMLVKSIMYCSCSRGTVLWQYSSSPQPSSSSTPSPQLNNNTSVNLTVSVTKSRLGGQKFQVF